MAKRGLTDAGIKSIKSPATGQVDHFDAPFPGLNGRLAVRISASGTKSFVVIYRFDGKQRRDTLSPRYPALSLAAAREKARAMLELVQGDKDPRIQRAEQKAESREAQADTYDRAVDDFIQKYAIAKKGNRRWKDQKQLLLKANPEWHSRAVSDITRRDIHDALDSRMEAGKPYMANRIYEQLRAFFKWLYKRDRVPENLMLKVDKPFSGEAKGGRAWSDEELKDLWAAADKLDGRWPAYLRLLILLGQRRDEVSGMRWDELDLEAGTWTLPEARHKGKRGHTFPMTPLAVRILKGLPRIKGNPFVFPGRGDKPMTVGSKVQAKIKKASGIGDFTYKDARDTFRTGLDELRIPPHVKNECLGHARQGVGDVHYSHYDYLDEQREAFEAWAEHVEALVYPEGVVPLHG